uniref:Methyltransferase-like protein 23 n=1 Tax=Phallusia mammillata TaxID=59560 RepID=A0A6F9DKP9_9ASCI|nr:methyltransferase-like protein 23 [Phallusia mammillata]
MESTSLQTKKTFKFTNSSGKDSLEVTISETMEPHYSQYVWPCSVVLAQYIWHHSKSLFKGKHLLEIGAGTALPSIVATMCASPDSVTITDNEFFPKCFENCRKSIFYNNLGNICDHFNKHNGSNVKRTSKNCPIHLMGLTWGQVSPHFVKLLQKKNTKDHHAFPNVILGSDCFYDETLFEDVISTIYYLLKSSADFEQQSSFKPVFLCTYQTRSADWSISALLHKWKLEYEDIPLSDFAADESDIADSGMPGNHKIEMMKISLKDK